MATAQNGSAVVSPQFTGPIQGNVHINNNVSYQHGQETTSDRPDSKEYIKKCQTELKSYLDEKTTNLSQGTRRDGPTSLNKIYTELYITEGSSGEVNTEHEVNELQFKRPPSVENQINLNDIFKPLPNEDNPPRRVLTTGIAGIGKTVSVLKFTQDWARKEDDQTFEFIFPFTFRELNLIKDETLSLMTLITSHFDEVKDLKASDYNNLKVLFIFDGLDESQSPLNFKGNRVLRSVTEDTTVDILLTNLIKGELMYKASVWITSRPAASAKVPPYCIHRVTEVQGFNDKQKEKYFLKEVSDKEMAQKILEHLQSKPLRSLYIMCHIPVFCWISAQVFQSLLTEPHRGELPKTVTEMYTHFLIVQTKITHEKNYEGKEADKELIMKLGKLAFEQLQKGNIIFEEKDLTSCQIDLTHAAVHSGVCTQIIKKERGLHHREMYCFIHLTVQEFLASLYVLETFIDSGENLLQSQKFGRSQRKLSSLHKEAVDMALESTNGQWDLFLRFLLGLSQEDNQKLIQKDLGFKEGSPGSNEETIKYIHKKIKKLSHAHQSINLFHCLNELGDQSLVQQVQNYLRSGDVNKMLPAQWSALAYLLLMTDDGLDFFDLKKYCKSDDVLQRLLPVLKVSKIASLKDCNLGERCCTLISSVLKLKSCRVEELDLSGNKLKWTGMRLLSYGLESPNCRLQKLTLADCQLSVASCSHLASSLKSNPAHLRVLDLSNNQLKDAGVNHLSDFLKEPLCKLEKLRLKDCNLAARCCTFISSVLELKSCRVEELDLSRNKLQDHGMELLSDGLKSPNCRLQKLTLADCQLSVAGCGYLASSLKSNPAHLRVLDLSNNQLKDAGVDHLSEFLKEPLCKLEKLSLKCCSLTDDKCLALCRPSSLKELDLTDIQQFISVTVMLADCQFSEVGCGYLASSLKSNPAHLRVLDLSNNQLKDAGVDRLSEFLKEPLCKLEKLSLKCCSLTDDKCLALCRPSSLKELDLSDNQQTDRGDELLRDRRCREIQRLPEKTLDHKMTGTPGPPVAKKKKKL